MTQSNPNPVVHTPGSILSVGPMEVSQMEEMTLGIPEGKFSMYKHGMSPSVSRVQFAFYQEMCKMASAMGIKIAEYTQEQFFSKGSLMGVGYFGPFSDVILPPIVGLDSMEHRYFAEDIPIGTVVYDHLAQKFGVEVPIIESIIWLCVASIYILSACVLQISSHSSQKVQTAVKKSNRNIRRIQLLI